ncbi:hypothetical protein, partial [Pseudomonas aeruginosa]
FARPRFRTFPRPAAFNRSVLEFLARVDGVAPDVETS